MAEDFDRHHYKVQMAPNGWNGIFVVGDEALGLANTLRKCADTIEKGEDRFLIECFAIRLRRLASELDRCNHYPDRGWPFFG